MLIKIGPDLFRVLDLQHVTPGNLRGFVRAKFRNMRNDSLSDQSCVRKTSSSAPSSTSGRCSISTGRRNFHFMDTGTYEQLTSAEALGDSVNYIIPEATIKVEFYAGTGGHRDAADRGSEGRGYRPRHQGRDRQRAGQAGDARDRPGVQVPPFVNPGDVIRVSTETGEYLSRV